MEQPIKQSILGVSAFLPKREQKGSGRNRKTASRAGQLQAWSTGCHYLLISLCYGATTLPSLKPGTLTITDSVQPKRKLPPFPGHKIVTSSLSFFNLFCRLFLCAMFWQSTTGYGNLQVSCLPHVGRVNSPK